LSNLKLIQNSLACAVAKAPILLLRLVPTYSQISILALK